MKSPKEPFYITQPYDVLLRGSKQMPVGVYQLQTATAAQLTRLHYSPNSITLVKARVKVLTDHGFIQVDRYPVKDKLGIYHNVSCFTLANRGAAYLRQAGFEMSEVWRGAKEADKHALFVEHRLGINDVLISAALLSRVTDQFHLDHFEQERALRRHPYQAHWQDAHGAHTVTVIPDAFLDFRHADRRMPVLLEHDRDSEYQTRFRQKIRAYSMLIKTGSYQQLFGVQAITVAFTTFEGMERVEKMRRWTRAELGSELYALGAVFCFANLEYPPTPQHTWLDPIWYTAHEGSEPEPLLVA